MTPLLASVRATGGLDRVDHAVQKLEDEWRKHGDVPLGRLWAEQRRSFEAEAGQSILLLSELVKTDLRCRFARGQQPTVADYLDRFPELEAADSRVLSLIYEEFCLAEERGRGVDVEAFCDRYPRWKESLVSQLQYHHLFSQAAGIRPKVTPFPEAGDTFEEFQLVSLLGKGGTSRVFLARDLSLGGKQVVLKVSLDRGREPQAQGALDHPHIVPVNSVVFGDDEMRGLSMPYRPGLPLDEVIRRVDPASKPHRAMALWEVLVQSTEGTAEAATDAESASPSEARASGPKGDGWEGFPSRGTYAQGVAWVVKVVAEALHYAHGQQTFHRDVKPANVLLTVGHGPQLLDFNLAESPHSASQAQAAMHGGTLPYMAPEQIEAFLNPDLWGKVGASADIYSLGLVLRELLTGQAPDLPAETLAPARAMRVLLDRRPLLDVSVRRANPAIPHALEAIVAKCLSVTVEGRYPDAVALAEDLDRFLHHKPLAHAVNPSRRERGTNWVIRNRPRLAVAAGVALACLVGLCAGLAMSYRRPIASHPDLIAAVAALDQGRVSSSEKLLKGLVERYPDSCLPRAYLGFARDAEDPRDADRWFHEAFGMAWAKDELVAWSPRDPGLSRRFRESASNRFARNEEIEARGDGSGRDKGLDRLAASAFEFARKLREAGPQPGSGTEEDWLARAEGEPPAVLNPDADLSDLDQARARQELGEYDKVIEMAGRAIDRLNARTDASDMDGEFHRSLFEWRRLRSRALTMAARRLRTEGAGRAQEALAKLDAADKDLQLCKMFVEHQTFLTVDHLGLERIRVAGLMTRVEAYLDLGRVEKARARLRSARDALNRFYDLTHTVAVDRTPKDLDRFRERLRTIEQRLERESGVAAGEAPTSPSSMTRNDVPPGR
jgi:serine/threonine protein kinase